MILNFMVLVQFTYNSTNFRSGLMDVTDGMRAEKFAFISVKRKFAPRAYLLDGPQARSPSHQAIRSGGQRAHTSVGQRTQNCWPKADESSKAWQACNVQRRVALVNC